MVLVHDLGVEAHRGLVGGRAVELSHLRHLGHDGSDALASLVAIDQVLVGSYELGKLGGVRPRDRHAIVDRVADELAELIDTLTQPVCNARFGVGEATQALDRSRRIVRRGCECCVHLVHEARERLLAPHVGELLVAELHEL